MHWKQYRQLKKADSGNLVLFQRADLILGPDPARNWEPQTYWKSSKLSISLETLSTPQVQIHAFEKSLPICPLFTPAYPEQGGFPTER